MGLKGMTKKLQSDFIEVDDEKLNDQFKEPLAMSQKSLIFN